MDLGLEPSEKVHAPGLDIMSFSVITEKSAPSTLTSPDIIYRTLLAINSQRP